MPSRSYDRRLLSDMVRMSRRRGGSHGTREARERELQKFAIWLRRRNIQLRTADSIRNAHFRCYIEERKLNGFGLGALENVAGYLRAVAPQLSLTNKELGIDGRCRDGKKRPCPEALHVRACNEIRHLGVVAGVMLQWTMGLRSEEALAAAPSLQSWRHAILLGRRPYVIFGTKGGRQREVELPDHRAALQAIDYALGVLDSQCSKHLVPSRTRRTALRIYRRECQKVGLTRVYSSYSLRYAFACRLVRYFARRGLGEREAYAAVALSLGHGDGRGRYVKQVYGRELPPYETLIMEHARPDIRVRGRSFRYHWFAPTGVCLLPEMWDVATLPEVSPRAK